MVQKITTIALLAILGTSTAGIPPQLCAKTSCTYQTNGGVGRTTIHSSNLIFENFRCGKKALSNDCECTCHDSFTCILEHHGKTLPHCEAKTLPPTPFPTPSPTDSPTPFPTDSPTPFPTYAPALSHGDVIGLYRGSAFLGINSGGTYPVAIAKSALDYENNPNAYFKVERSGTAGFTLQNIHSNLYLHVTDGGLSGTTNRGATGTIFNADQDGESFGLYSNLAGGKAYVVFDGSSFVGDVRTSFSAAGNPWLSFESVKESYPYVVSSDVYKFSSTKVFFVQSTSGVYQVPQNFRDDACRSLGSTVCSWRDIDGARTYGNANYCACSYLSDGSAYFPMQPYSGSGCGPSGGGLNGCGQRSKADVCCSVSML